MEMRAELKYYTVFTPYHNTACIRARKREHENVVWKTNSWALQRHTRCEFLLQRPLTDQRLIFNSSQHAPPVCVPNRPLVLKGQRGHIFFKKRKQTLDLMKNLAGLFGGTR